jgi:hypothetical protein
MKSLASGAGRCGRFLFWSALILGSFSSASAAEGGGPIAIRNQFAPGLFFLYPTPEAARVLDPGRFEIGTNAAYSSVFNQEKNGPAQLLLDFEVLRWAFNARWGVRDRFDVDVEVPFLYFTDGFLDQFVKDYHDFFGFPQGGRDQAPNNKFRYVVSSGGKTLYHTPDPGTFALSDTVLNARYRILPEKEVWPGLVFKASVKVPTGSSSGGFGSGHLDYGGFFLMEKNWSRFSAYGNAGAVIPGPLTGADSSVIAPQPFGVFVIAGEYRFVDWFSMVLQMDSNTRPYQRAPFPLFTEHATEIGGGFRFKIAQRGSLEIGFVDGFGSVPDFTASLDAKWLF